MTILQKKLLLQYLLNKSVDMEEKNNEKLDKDLLDDDLLDEGDWITSIKQLKKKDNKLSKQNKVLIWVLVVLVVVSFLLFNFKYFFDITLRWNHLTSFEQTYLNAVKNYVLKYITNTSSSGKQFYKKNWSPSVIASNMNNFIDDPSILFYQKQFAKEQFITNEFILYNKILKKIKDNQELLVKYKFFPKALSVLIKDIRMMPILLTLNSIKIYMIDYVYIQTWRFVNEILSPVLVKSPILRNTNVNKTELEISLIEDIQKIRESWVNLYLENIKFNYMHSSLSDKYFSYKFYEQFKNIIDNRVEKLWLDDQSRKNFIWNYIFLIKDVYDKTNELFEKQDINQLPVNIKLISYDPSTQTLSFNVQIMLEDKYNAKTSVIKIATNLVSLLRESRLIIWSNIKMDNIKVQKVSKNIWGSKITFDETSLLFKTSVQSKVNVEVTDIEK